MRRTKKLILTGSFLAFIAVLGTAAAVSARQMRGGPWDERLVDLVAFVEEDRELTFTRSVPVRFVEPEVMAAEIAATYEDYYEANPDASAQDASSLRSFGLAEGSFDYGDEAEAFNAAAVGAYYDAETATMVIPVAGGDSVSEVPPSMRPVIVHELVHALQAQRFAAFVDDDWMEIDLQDGIIEGDATLVENRFYTTLTDDEWDELVADYDESGYAEDYEEYEEIRQDTQSIIPAFFDDPYILGTKFVEVVHAEGGFESVNNLYTSPPSDSTAMLDPWGFLGGDRTLSVSVPAEIPSGVEPWGSVYGGPSAVQWFYTFSTVLGLDDALEAARAWGSGQTAHYFNARGDACFVSTLSGDDRIETRVLRKAANAWAIERPGDRNVFPAYDFVRIEACDPGTDTDLNLTADFSGSLTAVATVIDGESWARSENQPLALGRCIAINQVAEYGPGTWWLDPVPEEVDRCQ